MSPQWIVIGVMVITFAIGWTVLRPLMPRFAGWTRAHKRQTDNIFSVICLLWGGGVWYLVISRNAYTNTFAMVMASILISVGVFSIVRLLKRA